MCLGKRFLDSIEYCQQRNHIMKAIPLLYHHVMALVDEMEPNLIVARDIL